jgi:hypothetical protein
MLFHSYLRRGAVYVPTVVKLKTGAYMDIEPVAVVAVANTEALHRAFLDTTARQNAVVPHPPKDDWPPPVLLKYAGVKTWSAFSRGTSVWSINEKDGAYQIIGYRTHAKGYWAEDTDQIMDFPPGTTIDDVIERMIAILQDAALRAEKSLMV